MQLLHRRLLKDVLITSLITIGVLTFLLVIGNIFTRLFDMIMNKDVPLWFIGEFILILIPFSLVFTLPWGLLTGILLVFGRLSADSELVAIRASGISLSAFSSPVLLLSVGLSFVCLLINFYIAPFAQEQMKKTLYNLASSSPLALFDNDTIIDQLPGKRIYVGRKVGNVVENLHVWELDDKKRPIRSIRAARARITADETNKAITLSLYNARMEERDPADPADLRRVQAGRHFEELPIKIPLARLLEKTAKLRPSALNISDLIGELSNKQGRSNTDFTPMLTEIQKRVASSLSCLTFALVALPLAVRSHRRETSVGVVLSFAVVLTYYFLIIIAETFNTKAAFYPELLIWTPNILFQLIGLLTFLKICKQ